MKKTFYLFSAFAFAFITNAFGQKPTIELTFTAVENTSYVPLDSIKVINRNQGDETMIYWSDTTLSLEINQGDTLLYVGYATLSTTGVSEVSDQILSFEVYQNYPNPMGDRSEISMYIPHTGNVHVMITDLQGGVVLRNDRQLDGGHHSFRFYPGDSHFYFLKANWNGINRSIQMISTGQQDGASCRLEYMGIHKGETALKASFQVNDFVVRQSGILDSPEQDTSYTFQFATNIPCPGTPTVEYEGQVYNTIQIFSQCWLKENLNVGTMIQGTQPVTDNDTIEKYCFNNEPDSCTKYGGLYQWNEMMQYTTQQGVQGICPVGWHLPSDEEWKVLEGAVDSQYGIGDPVWDIYFEWRGYDANTNLINTCYCGDDLYGFSGLLGGYRLGWGIYIGSFLDVNYCGYWWTSALKSNFWPYLRWLDCLEPGVMRAGDSYSNGFSVRCLRD